MAWNCFQHLLDSPKFSFLKVTPVSSQNQGREGELSQARMVKQTEEQRQALVDEGGAWMLIMLSPCDLRTPGEFLYLGECWMPPWLLHGAFPPTCRILVSVSLGSWSVIQGSVDTN